MSNTIEVTFKGLTKEKNEELVAMLSSINFDAFEEFDFELKAFIGEDNYNMEALIEVADLYKISFTLNTIVQQNWNELWESNFQPVIVDDFCAIRASFHKPIDNVKFEIVITPKMSFGTGHHATTNMMINTMSKFDFEGKRVADFGTGTGILAILAEKMGSNYILAIDNDEWSIENAIENIENNDCDKIKIERVDSFMPNEKFDVILANINKNVIIANSLQLAKSLNEEGFLLLSGLLKTDEQDLINEFLSQGLNHIRTIEKDNWICLVLK